MAAGRIDPELAREIRHLEETGDAERTVAVIIECVGEIEAGEGGVAGLERMGRGLHTLQQRVLERLEQLGAGVVERSALVNALFASLTPAQVVEIAHHPDVRMVRLSRPEQVTTS